MVFGEEKKIHHAREHLLDLCEPFGLQGVNGSGEMNLQHSDPRLVLNGLMFK
jgi:hypothetical protein